MWLNSGTAGPYQCRNIDMIGLISIADLGYDEPMLGDDRFMSPTNNRIFFHKLDEIGNIGIRRFATLKQK